MGSDTETIVLAPYGRDPETNAPYAAHKTQQAIRDWVRSVRAGTYKGSGIPIFYLQHGVNAGGTRGVLTPVIEYLLEEPGLNVLIGRKDFNDLRLSVMRTFFEMVPPDIIGEQNVQEHWYKVQGPRGESTVFFRELKDVKGLGSQEFAVIVVCEAHELSEFALRTLKQRCRQGRRQAFILLEGNPPSEGHWLLTMTDKNHPNYDPDLTLVRLSSYENWDFMNPAYRQSLETMPPAWKRRYLLGEAGALPDGTPVYPSFVEAVHVRDTRLVPDRPIIRGWDFGLRRAACVWGQRTDNGQMLFHREWLAIETPEEAFIDGVIQRTREWFGNKVCMDFGDPAATHRDPHGVATLQRLQSKGISLRYRQTTYGERIPLINRKFSELIAGEPAVIVSPFCRMLIEGMLGGWHYPTLNEEREFGMKKDLPFRDGTYEHLANALEYVFVNLYMASAAHARVVIQRIQHRERAFAKRQGPAVF